MQHTYKKDFKKNFKKLQSSKSLVLEILVFLPSHFNGQSKLQGQPTFKWKKNIMVVFENNLLKKDSAEVGSWVQDVVEVQRLGIMSFPAKETQLFKVQCPKSVSKKDLMNLG